MSKPTPLNPMIGVLIQNDNAASIPPRSVVVVTSVVVSTATATQEAETVTHVDQYGCGKSGNVMVTGSAPIPSGKQGRGFYDQFLYVSIDDAIADPMSGEEWGPSDDSWTITRDGKGFFAHGYAETGDPIKRSMFLRTFVRAPASICSSSSSSSDSQSSGSGSASGSVSGSSSSSADCGCITVVTSVSCLPGPDGGLTVTYGSARGCC